MEPGIYVITNTATGKIYVGSSREIRKRKRRHFGCLDQGKHPNSHLQRAYNTDGAAAFTFTVVEHCAPEQLTEREAWWIDWLGTKDQKRGYNYYDPVIGSRGIKHTETARAKMSAAQKGLSNHFFGRTHTPEARERMAEARRGRPGTWVGRTHSPEARAKMSAAAKLQANHWVGRKHTPESRERMAAAQQGRSGTWIGRTHSPESKAKISAAKKGRAGTWTGRTHSPESKAKISAAAKLRPNVWVGRKHSPETIEKLRAARLANAALYPKDEQGRYIKQQESDSGG